MNKKKIKLSNVINSVCNSPDKRLYGAYWEKRNYEDVMEFINDPSYNGQKDKEDNYLPYFITKTWKTKNYHNSKAFKDDDGRVFDNIFIDFDADEKADRTAQNALEQAVRVAKKLKDSLNLDVLVNFSGSKGGHIHILFNPIKLQHPAEVLELFSKQIDSNYKVTTDPAVYTKLNGLMRVPCTIHNKTGKYGHFINFEDSTGINEVLNNSDYSPKQIIEKGAKYFIPELPDKNKNTEIIQPLLKHLDELAGEIEKETNSKCNYEYEINTEINYNSTDDEFTKKFLELYYQGNMWNIGHAVMYMFKRAGWSNEQILGFFKAITPSNIDNKAHTWLRWVNNQNTAGKYAGFNYFCKKVKESVHNNAKIKAEDKETKINELINYFKSVFIPDKSIYKTPPKLHEKGYLYSEEALYAPELIIDGKPAYLRIERGKGGYKYSFCYLKDDNSEPEYLTQTFQKTIPLTTYDEKRNAKFGQWLKGRVEKGEVINFFNQIADDLRNIKGFTQITGDFKDYKEKSDVQDIDALRREAEEKGFEFDEAIKDLAASPNKETIILASSLALEKRFNIKKTVNTGEYYYFDDVDEYYKPMDKDILSFLIWKNYGYNFRTETSRKILDGIVKQTEINEKYIVAKNGLLNKQNGTLESKEKIKELLITDTLRFDNKGKITLLNYIENVQLFNDENETLVEKTLKEVCIPKNNQKHTKIYIDRLQRLGANLLGRKRKSIAYYYTQKQNTGKSALRSLTSLIMDCAVIHPKSLGDNFNYELIGDKKAIIFDETKKGQLEDYIDDLKLFSSPDSRRDQRVIYSSKKIKVTYGNVEIYSNYLITLQVDEKALFDRIDVIELPNQFVEPKYAHTVENGYPINDNLFDNEREIEKDIAGLEWRASASIQEYIRMDEKRKTYACRQTEEETRNIILKVDPLTEFIGRFCEPDESETITNREILLAYKKWLDLNGYPVPDDEQKLAVDIGYKIKDHFDNVKIKTKIGAAYKLRLMSIEEVETQLKHVWMPADDNLTDGQIDILQKLTGDRKVIYQNIKKGKYNTINKLHQQYPNISVFEHIKALERIGIIYNTFNASIS